MSPNRQVDFNLYPDINTRTAAEWIVKADTFRFDLSDQLPTQLNNYLWSLMDDLVQAAPDPDAMAEVMVRVEAMASGKTNAFLPVVYKEVSD